MPAAKRTRRLARGQRQSPGVHPGVDAAIEAAARAFRAFQDISLASRDQIIASIRKTALDHAESLAREAHQETGLGGGKTSW